MTAAQFKVIWYNGNKFSSDRMVKERVGGLQGRQRKCFLLSARFASLEGWTDSDSDSGSAQLGHLGLASCGLETQQMQGNPKPEGQPRGDF